jgi:hypothetical protein
VQGDERSFFGALHVAGHGTGSARSGVDIGCSHKRVGAFCRFGIMGALSVVLGSWGSRSGSRKGRGLGER